MLFKLFFSKQILQGGDFFFSATVLPRENISEGVCLSIPLEASQLPVLLFFGCLQAKNTLCTINLLPVTLGNGVDRCSGAAVVEIKAPQQN